MSSPKNNNHLTSIAIVGASGTIGSHITSSLLQTPNLAITALTRSNSPSDFPPRIKTAIIDYSHPETITSALEGHDALIITLAVSAPPSTQETLIRAAAQAGVKWILPNEFGMYNSASAQRETVGEGKMRARELITTLGMHWIGVTCGFWYEHSLSQHDLFGIDIPRREAILLDSGTQKINVSTWGFAGKAVAALVALPVGARGAEDEPSLNSYANKMVYVSSFAVSQRDMLASIQRVTNTSDDDWQITNVDARKRFEEAKEAVGKGDRSAFGRMLYTRYFYDDEGLFEKSYGLDNAKLGLDVDGEELDEATGRAVELGRSGYWDRYGRN